MEVWSKLQGRRGTTAKVLHVILLNLCSGTLGGGRLYLSDTVSDDARAGRWSDVPEQRVARTTRHPSRKAVARGAARHDECP